MKKKLAVLLAAVMVAAMVPVTAMATTANSVNKVVTVEKGGETGADSLLVIKDSELDLKKALDEADDYVEFTVELNGAEWGADLDQALVNEVNDTASAGNYVVIEKITSKILNVKIYRGYGYDSNSVWGPKAVGLYSYIPLVTDIKANGDITVTVNSRSSVVSSGTYTYAVAVAGAATAKVAGTVSIPELGTTLKNITIAETAAGAIEASTSEKEEYIKLKLNKDFNWADNGDVVLAVGDIDVAEGDIDTDERTITFEVEGASTKASEIILKGLEIIPDDDAEIGDVAEVTISGAGITKTTLEVGTYVDYGVTIKIYDEEEEMPVFYSGKVYDEEDDTTLAVQIKEIVADSINDDRKVTFEFPKGVDVEGIWIVDENDTDANKDYNFDAIEDAVIKDNKVTIRDLFTEFTPDEKTVMTVAFTLAISPEFTGDVEVAVGGAALDNEATLKVAEVKRPYTVEAKVNEVNIDYRNVAVTDIVIKEAKAGVLEDGDVIALAVDHMQFEKGMKYEVTAGDIEVDDIEVADGVIFVVIEDESSKAAGEITLSNIELYLSRALPAGDYDLYSVMPWNVIGRDQVGYDVDMPNIYYGTVLFESTALGYFDVDEIVEKEGYVKVITAGRDQDDSTFTTQIVVPIGETTIYAGTKAITVDVPAFITADGYTMMPLRAVVEALSGAAIVTWDDASKTATVLFGARVISMTIGQKVMLINGVPVAMTAAPVIVDSRTFLPLRDLGYALGLNDAQINWDAATKTATLN